PAIAELDHASTSPEEEREFVRGERKRRRRVDAQPLSALSHEFAMASFTWIRDRSDTIRGSADPVLAEAIEVAMHDAIFIAAKLSQTGRGHESTKARRRTNRTRFFPTALKTHSLHSRRIRRRGPGCYRIATRVRLRRTSSTRRRAHWNSSSSCTPPAQLRCWS